ATRRAFTYSFSSEQNDEFTFRARFVWFMRGLMTVADDMSGTTRKRHVNRFFVDAWTWPWSNQTSGFSTYMEWHMGSLDVQIETRDGCTVVRLSGDGGVANADRLRTSLIRLTALRPSLTVFDLAGVVFVASLFLGLLVGFRRDMLRVGGQVRLAALQPNV